MQAHTVSIISALQTGDFSIHLTFDDGHEQLVNFEPFLSRAYHPDIRRYLDPARFSAYRLEHGELIWGDYDLCFPLLDLYHNQLENLP